MKSIDEDNVFKIKRYSIKDSLKLLESLKTTQRKSYLVTNNDQRFNLIQRIISKKLSIKEVRKNIFIGCQTMWHEIHYS